MKKLKRESEVQESLPATTQSKVVTAIQYYQMSLVEKGKYAASFGIPTGLLLALLGAGEGGLGVGVLVGLTTGYFSEEVKSGFVDKLPWFREQTGVRKRKLHWWFTGEDTRAVPSLPEQAQQQPSGEAEASPLSEIDQLFQAEQEKEEVPGIARLIPNDIIRNTPLDEYRICIGRSLTKKGNPPVWINIFGQHLKIIGASQYGKSSMAACCLYIITRTHSPSKVLIALLDMEHKTSKLFSDCQHVAQVKIEGNWVVLHAKTREQVLEHLGHCVNIMDQRYKLSEEEVEEEPILLVYLEEFLALKDYFKRLIDSLSGGAKEQAKKDYAQLVFRVSEIARRGLKVKVQFLLCAQVDYRDEDFQEALINITGGMSFNVRSSAAQAAGFLRTELLKQNEKDDKKGQAVVETPDCKDLVLAPEYNLKKKLLALEKSRQKQGMPLPNGKRASIIAPANTLKLPDDEDSYQQPAHGIVTDELDERQVRLVTRIHEELDEGGSSEANEAKIIPIVPEKGRRAEDVDLNAAIAVYNLGNTSRYQLAKIFDLSESQGRKLKEIIETQAESVGR